jgi:hypothetical protein
MEALALSSARVGIDRVDAERVDRLTKGNLQLNHSEGHGERPKNSYSS